MAFKAKRPVFITVRPEVVQAISSSKQTYEDRPWAINDCNCFVIHQKRGGIVAIAEIGTREDYVEDGEKRSKYPFLKVYLFKEMIPLENAFDNTPINRRFKGVQKYTFLRELGFYDWTPETEAAAAEAVKILLKTHPYKILYLNN